MKKFLASFVLLVSLIAFAAPAFAVCYLQSHNSFDAKRVEGKKVIHYKQCNCSWLDDDFAMQSYSGPDTNCPVCSKSINFYNYKKK